jgi:L-histidine N-alpha-methyltransferase
VKPWPAMEPESDLARAVRQGLVRSPRALPPWLFYDARGSELFEEITRLPEYYLTRAERSILETHADSIVAWASQETQERLHVVELGAGSAVKTGVLLEAVVRRQGRALYLPVDISETALQDATLRLQRELPNVEVRPVAATHEDALPAIRAVGPRRMVLFLGSSIGNYEDKEAIALLQTVSRALAPGAALLLGADRRKDPEVLLPAYDDAAGVTAAFNKNLWVRLNRELCGNFDLDAWKHVAVWNDERSQIEMHLESTRPQEVHLRALGERYTFAEGERVHTESSVKYDRPRIEHILRSAGFEPQQVLTDPEDRFDLHLARFTRG